VDIAAEWVAGLAGARDFSLLHSVQTEFGANPMSTGGFIPGVNNGTATTPLPYRFSWRGA
jgi:hypothetical protein